VSFDVDVDVASHTPKEHFGVRAIIYNADAQKISPHPSGYYVDTNMPVDQLTGNAAIPFKEAEAMGFIKIDLLTNTFYDVFKTKQQVLDALVEPDWDLLQKDVVIETIPHLHAYADLLRLVKPRDMETLADILALIRPGKTKYLEEYLRDKSKVRTNLYRRSPDGFSFKRSHAIATATLIVAFVNHTRGRTLVTF
jgi:hypothetical protein